MAPVRLMVCNRRKRLFQVRIDPNDPPAAVGPPDGDGPQVDLHWANVLDPAGGLRRCPVCGCRELFTRKDFPQAVGLVLVVVVVVVAVVLMLLRLLAWAVMLLGAVALFDAVLFAVTGRCLVCYRCRSEVRNVPIASSQRPWDLATGDKYRHQPESGGPPAATSVPGSPGPGPGPGPGRPAQASQDAR